MIPRRCTLCGHRLWRWSLGHAFCTTCARLIWPRA